MNVVIDISEELYQFIIDKKLMVMDLPEIENSIKNGIVLPKGHGDLIDRDKLDFRRCPTNVNGCPDEYDFTCRNCDFGITFRFRVFGEEVVIPADNQNRGE